MPPARTPTVTAPLGFDDEDGEAVADEPLPVPEAPEPEPEPEVDEAGVPLAEEALAAAWKASKVLFAVGLTAKTIPASQ